MQTLINRDIYSGHPPPGGGGILSILKNREEFEEGHEKRKGKEEKMKRVLKHTLNYLYKA